VIIFHDFETYSEIDITKTGAYVYAMHESTDIICLAYSFGNDKDIQLWTPRQRYNPDDLFLYISLGEELHAWNALFEYYIWNYVGCRRYGWPSIPITQYRDTMALASSYGFPLKLDSAAHATGVSEKKDKRGVSLINKLSKPNKKGKRVLYDDAPADYQDMYDYCKQDVRSERAIHYFLPAQALSPSEEKTWQHCQIMNTRGILMDIPTTKNMIKILETFEKKETEKLTTLTNGIVSTGNQRDRILDWISTQDSTVDLGGSLTAKVVKDYIKSPPKGTDPKVIEILTLRANLSRTSIKKYYKIIDCASDDGRIRDFLVYHGATTGRYAGRNFQPHNLPRGNIKKHDFYVDLINTYADDLDAMQMIYDRIMDLGSGMVRSMIIALAGHRFVISDYSTIENRATAWMADDDVQMNVYTSGVDPYIDFAKDYYGIPPERVNEAQRLFGKISILGLGYGMGVNRFMQTCEQWGMGIEKEEAQKTVNFYREKYWKTALLWEKLNQAAMQCVLDKVPTRYKRIRFEYLIQDQDQHMCKSREYLQMVLPSGRKISYYQPEVRMTDTPWGQKKHAITYMGQDGFTRKWERIHIIPGRLTENASSGLCRDILVSATHRAEAQGYPVVMSVHDELVCEVPYGRGSVEELNNIMVDIDRKRYPDFPVKVAGFETERYKKG
jgi:DNA polymerase